MKHINLLPWRQKEREEQTKIFTGWSFISSLLGMGIGLILYLYARALVADAEASTEILNEEIRVLNQKVIQIAKYKQLQKVLVARMQVVQSLQSTRPLTVHLFDELTKIIPEGIYLTKVTRNGNRVTITGSSESNTTVSKLMENIAKNSWIARPELREIKRPDEENKGDINGSPSSNKFHLIFTVEPKKVKK